jgi:hypothetical protein
VSSLKWLFWAGAAGLAPWIVYLFFSQVPPAPADQIRLLAVGLNIAMMLGILPGRRTSDPNPSRTQADLTPVITFVSHVPSNMIVRQLWDLNPGHSQDRVRLSPRTGLLRDE